jgi:predicted Zn-dependent peptidase
MQWLLNNLAREVNTLYQSATEINSHNFLENYQRINKQVLINSLKTVTEVAQELDNNENYETAVSINANFIDGVKLWL